MEKSEGFWRGLKRGLSKTSARLNEGIREIFKFGTKTDQQTLKALENLLVSTDMGMEAAVRFTQRVADLQFNGPAELQVKQKLAEEIEGFLREKVCPIVVKSTPHIIMLCGVNGSGKTTTVAKLAHKFQQENKSVIIGACDTFRAAAVEQLSAWAKKISCPIISGGIGSDAASIAYKTVEQAIKEQIDVVLIDTAGRLHNHKNLMEELAKISRVIRRLDESAPHNVVLVLDATVGQNAFTQVEVFSSFVDVNGLILTKLDGTAKGGIIIRIAAKYDLRLHAIGTGEGIDDLGDFSALEFAKSLVGS